MNESEIVADDLATMTGTASTFARRDRVDGGRPAGSVVRPLMEINIGMTGFSMVWNATQTSEFNHALSESISAS
jgi:hypothetical protein